MRAADFEVELDVRRRAEPSRAGEVGAAGEGRAAAVPTGDVIELAVQEVGLLDGAHGDVSLNPLGAGSGQRFLGQRLLELDAAVRGNPNACVPGRGGVRRADAARLAVEKAHAADAVQNVAQGLVGVDGEVGGDDRQVRAGFQLFAEEVADAAGAVIDDAVRAAGGACGVRRGGRHAMSQRLPAGRPAGSHCSEWNRGL